MLTGDRSRLRLKGRWARAAMRLAAIPVYSIASITVVGIAWWVVTAVQIFPAVLLPSPGAVWQDFVSVSTTGYNGSSIWINLEISLSRLAVGFAFVILIGVPLGLLMGRNRVIKGILDPLLEFYRPLPALAYMSLLIIWFGIGETSKVIVLALAGLPPVIVTTAAAARSVRIERIEGARSLGLRGFSLFRYVIAPSCLPDILTGIRVGFGLSFAAIVAAELLASTSGIGWMVWNASEYAVSTVVIIGIVLMGIIGVLVDWALSSLRKRLVPWAGRG